MNEKEIEVHQMRDDKEISVENLKWPQKYEDFIKDIVQKFKLSKNALIESITLFTDDGDDNVISSKDDFNNFLETPLIKILFTAKGGEEIDDNNIIINPEPLKEIKIEEINIDDLMKDVFNIDEYKEQMNLDTKKFTQDFKNDLEKSINEILEENKKIAEKNIDLKLSQYIETSQKKDSDIKQSILNVNDILKEIRDQTEGMSDGINELYGAIVNKEIFISKLDALGGVNNNERKNVPQPKKKDELDMSGVVNPNPNPLAAIDDEEEKQILKIGFEQKKAEKIIDMKDAKFFNIDNIKIINLGNVPCKKFYFVKDEEKSSGDLFFFGNSKETNEYQPTNEGELAPKKSLNSSTTIKINNPQPGQEYKMIIYVKIDDKIVSDPFEIIVKIKQAEDPMKQINMKANALFEEIKNQFPNHQNLINQGEIINKLINNNLNKDEIVNDINIKIKEQEKEEINRKAENLYNELDFENVTLDKKEVLDYIINQNFDKEEVQKWINEKKTKVQPQPQSQPPAQPKNDEFEEKVKEIYDELEEGYGISGFIDEEAAKDKIRELKLDREQINQWIENTLLNGE